MKSKPRVRKRQCLLRVSIFNCKPTATKATGVTVFPIRKNEFCNASGNSNENSVQQSAIVKAIKGGNFLASLPIPTQIIVVCFLLLTALVNLFIGSGGTKWLLMGPIFVPMLIQLNRHPAFTQAIYRLGDCSTHHLTPLFAYFAILLTTAQKYDKNTGMGTLFAAMLPYSFVFLCIFIVQIVVWMTFNLPVGPGGVIWLS